MRKIFTTFIKVSLSFVIFFSLGSCNNNFNIFDSEKNDYCNVSFSISGYETSSRTILPTSADKEKLFFTLKGALEGETQKILPTSDGDEVEKMEYETLKKSGFRLDAGKWNFTLYGYKNKSDDDPVISGEATSTITAGTKNSIVFDMQPVESGTGSINVTLKYSGIDTESSISRVVAKITTIADVPVEIASDTWIRPDPQAEEDPDAVIKDIPDPDISGSGTIVYTKPDIDCGRYILCFTVEVENSKTGNTMSGFRNDIVVVAAFSESSATLDIQLNQEYSITYKNVEGATWTGVYPEKYNSYSAVTLPTTANISKTDKVFEGWYLEDNYSTKKETIPIGSAGAKIYYAKWSDVELYVHGEGGELSVAGNDTTGTGESSAPYATLNRAITHINSKTDSTKDWTIIIDGEVTGSTDISSLIAASLTIKGNTGSSSDVLKTTSGTVLSVTAASDITIENLKVANGTGFLVNSETFGGGLYVKATSAKVTLGTGSIITQNTSKYGAGVYVDTGMVNLSDGEICGNTASDSGGGVYVASGGTFNILSGNIGKEGSANNAKKGGGVYNVSNTTIMSGGLIAYNVAKYDEGTIKIGEGGGVYNANGIFTITSGTVTGNIAGDTGATSNTKAKGGGIYNAAGAKLIMSGGKIGEVIDGTPSESNHANYSIQDGGGIYNDGTLEFPGDSYQIIGNYAFTGGGIYDNTINSIDEASWRSGYLSGCFINNNASRNPQTCPQ